MSTSDNRDLGRGSTLTETANNLTNSSDSALLSTEDEASLNQLQDGYPSFEVINKETPIVEESLDDESTIPQLNDVKDLGKGFITTDKNKTNEYTILLIGEAGTGKTSLLSLFANILVGHGPDEYMLAHDKANEAGGPKNQSQTQEAMVYEFVSNNNVKVRLLDTPGLADIRGLAFDDLHKASIANAIKENISTINAVIVLANGTLERLGIATDYSLSKLSSIFPRTLDNNIGIIFTHVANPWAWNFDQSSLPQALQGIKNNQFVLDNPLAAWKKVNEKPSQKKSGKRVIANPESALLECHMKALEELALLFDWLDTLVPQPTTDIVNLYEQYRSIDCNIANVLSRASQLDEKKRKLKSIRQSADGRKLTMKQYENYRSVLTEEVWGMAETPHYNTVCIYPECHTNCHLSCKLAFSLDAESLKTCFSMTGLACRVCGHSVIDHRHYHSLWKKRDNTQVLIDEAEQNYNEVKQNADQEKMIIDLNEDIENLDQDIQETLTTLGRLIESYTKLSLSGSFAGLVEKSIKLLEMTLDCMRSRGADPKSVVSVEKSLEEMKKKLEVVQRADDKVKRNFRPKKLTRMAGIIKGSLKSGIQAASTMLKPKNKLALKLVRADGQNEEAKGDS